LFRVFEDTEVEVTFEHDPALKWHYVALKNHQNQIDSASVEVTRFITDKVDREVLNQFQETNVSRPRLLPLGFEVNLERLTVAVNDDYVSDVGQTEVLRLTSDNVVLRLERSATGHVTGEAKCEQMQVDNQMFGSGEHGYDFPVVFLPRGGAKERRNSPKEYLSFAGVTDRPGEIFLRLKIVAIVDGDSRLKLIEVDLSVGSFEVYLEDFLVFSLMKIGIEFADLATRRNREKEVGETCADLEYYDYAARDLGILFEPMIMLKKLRLGKYIF
jgi:hypothetical protein